MSDPEIPQTDDQLKDLSDNDFEILDAKWSLIFPCWEIGWGWMGVEWYETRDVLIAAKNLEEFSGPDETWNFVLAAIQSFSYLSPGENAHDSKTMNVLYEVLLNGGDAIAFLKSKTISSHIKEAATKNFLKYLRDYSRYVWSKTNKEKEVDLRYVAEVIGLVEQRVISDFGREEEES